MATGSLISVERHRAMTKKEKNQLQMLAYLNTVAVSRGKKPIDCLEALHIDVVRISEGKEPIKMKELV